MDIENISKSKKYWELLHLGNRIGDEGFERIIFILIYTIFLLDFSGYMLVSSDILVKF